MKEIAQSIAVIGDISIKLNRDKDFKNNKLSIPDSNEMSFMIKIVIMIKVI